jgi:CheY-like chemotaxis protein
MAANANLAEDYRVTLELRSSQTHCELNAHEAVLRPTLIWMLSQTITHVAEGSSVILSALTVGDSPAINFEISISDAIISVLQETLTNNPTGAEFLATLKGTIVITEAARDKYSVQFQLQQRRPLILVIDDNPDAIALLERYVTGMPYEIVSVHTADEGFELAQSMEPACIVLDILLPKTDGWKTLQQLRSNPRTQSIPILICSALDNPDLALSLGADDYLRKPPDRIGFIEALRRWTAPEH